MQETLNEIVQCAQVLMVDQVWRLYGESDQFKQYNPTIVSNDDRTIIVEVTAIPEGSWRSDTGRATCGEVSCFFTFLNDGKAWTDTKVH